MSQRSRTLARRAAVVLTATALTATAFALPASAAPTWLPIDSLSTGTAEDNAPEIAFGGKGSAVAVWNRWNGATHTVVAAKRAPGGAWQSPLTISASHTSVPVPKVALDSADNATAVWAPGDNFGQVRAASRSASAATWGAPVSLSSAGKDIDIAIDNQGNALAAWSSTAGGGGSRIYVVRKAAGGSWGTPVPVSPAGAERPDVAFDGAGNAQLVWEASVGGNANILGARRLVGQAWSTPTTVAASADDELEPRLAVDHVGNAVAIWDHHDAEGASRVEGTYRLAANTTWEAPKYVTPADQSGAAIDIDLDDQGNVLALWNSNVDDVGISKVSTLVEGGAWSAPTTVSKAGVDTQASGVRMDDAGNAVVTMDTRTDFTPATTVVARKPAGGVWTEPAPLSADGDRAGQSEVAVDNQGNVVVVWAAETDPATDRDIDARALDAAGPSTTMTQPAWSRQSSTSFTAAWSAADRWSQVQTKDVRFRQAPWNGGFGAQTDWKTDTTDNSGLVAGVAGRSYCFSARATDAVGNEGGWSAERCTATPVDDRTLAHTSAWTRGTNSAYYLGTYTSTKTNSAKLTRTGMQVKHLSLLVTTCANCGKVKVSFGGTTLGTFDLASSSTVRKKIVFVKSFTSVQTGTLTIQHVSPTGKTVYIDGVIARRF